MAEINDLNVVDASNTGRFPERQAAASVNDGARALEGIIARWDKDTNGSLASTGGSNAYVVAANQTLSAYYDGLTITFESDFTNTAAATLNVDSVSADAIVWPDGTVLAGGEIASGAKITVRHDGTNWQLLAGSNVSRMQLQAEQATTSGTRVTFSSIPAWAKEIVVMFDGFSTSDSVVPSVRIGDSGGIEISGYAGSVGQLDATPSVGAYSGGFALADAWAGTNVAYGAMTLTLEDSANNTWVAAGNLSTASGTRMMLFAGRKTLSGVLTQLEVDVERDGGAAFDGGAVNVLIKG